MNISAELLQRLLKGDNTMTEYNNPLEGIKLYTLTEIQKALGVSYKTMLRYVHSGKLKAVQIGGVWKVTEENFKRFINGD